MKSLNQTLFALSVLVLSPFALAQDEEDGADADQSEERVCINSRSVRTFDAFTDEYVYVREGSSEHFLITMRNRCRDLRDAQGIAFKDTTSRICADGFSEIIYPDRMGGGRSLQSCRIESIERVDSREDAEAIAEARAADDD